MKISHFTPSFIPNVSPPAAFCDSWDGDSVIGILTHAELNIEPMTFCGTLGNTNRCDCTS